MLAGGSLSPTISGALVVTGAIIWLVLLICSYRRNPNRWWFQMGMACWLWSPLYLLIRGWRLARALRHPLSPEEIARLPRVHLSADGKRLIRLPPLASLPRVAQD